MSKNISDLFRLELGDNLDDYVEDRHQSLLRIAKLAKDMGQITETTYQDLLLMEVVPNSWDEAFVQLESLSVAIVEAIEMKEYHILLERLAKGADMIDNETDPVKKAKYAALYETLSKQMEQMKAVLNIA